MLYIGTMRRYLCARKQTEKEMKNTDYTFGILGGMMISDSAFQALQDMIDDLGLEAGEVMVP